MTNQSAKGNGTIRLVLAEDHVLVRQGFVALLQLEGGFEVCAETDNGTSTLEAVNAHRPDLLLMDLFLKGEDGLELIKQVHAQHADLPILVVSMQDEQTYAERVLRAGAKGYMMKNQAADELVKAIHAVTSGELYVSDSMNARLLQRFIKGKGEQTETDVDSLSDRELQVFHLIGTGMPTRNIADELGISRKTVDTYREHIKNKLNLNDAAALMQRATTWVQEKGS